VKELETRRGRDTANLQGIVELYEQAYELAITNGFTQDAALAKELSCQVRLRHRFIVSVGLSDRLSCCVWFGPTSRF
jgi:hypothetical protein